MMEKSYRQFVAWVTRLRTDEFFIVRLKLTLFYTITAVAILGGSSLVLYNTLLSNLTDSINESELDPHVTYLIIDRTKDILQNRFILVDAIILFFVISIGFFLTKKTLTPITESMQKQKRFVADASHELRTPVAIAISGIEVALRNKNLDLASAKKVLENTLTEMREFSQLSNTLLDISKYDSHKKIEYSRIASNEIIQSIALKMEPLAREKDVTIQTYIQSQVLINGNKTELDRVFYNILDNAITHTGEGGMITITDAISSGMYTVHITDTGSGIPKHVLNKIFDPFFRGDAARTTNGAGLGLTITKKIIENHHGTISIKSEVNKGTTVAVSFPISSQ